MTQKLTPEQLEKRKKTNKKILKFGCLPILLLIGITMIIANFSGGSKPHKDRSLKNVKAVFDVPPLIGLNIDSVRKILGKPSDKQIEPSKLQMKMKLNTWNNSFDKDGYSLLVTFNPKTRHVTDFFIGTEDSSGLTSDYSNLLPICNVSDGNPVYSVKPVPAIKDNTKYTGIIIAEKTEDHSSAAYVEARELAKNKLKYPDEADFDWTPTYDKNEGENNYRVEGKVMAKNGFGVKKKLTFTCVLHYKGGDDLEDSSWDIVEDVSFEE